MFGHKQGQLIQCSVITSIANIQQSKLLVVKYNQGRNQNLGREWAGLKIDNALDLYS